MSNEKEDIERFGVIYEKNPPITLDCDERMPKKFHFDVKKYKVSIEDGYIIVERLGGCCE